MTWENARELFLSQHQPGTYDFYIARIGPEINKVPSSGTLPGFIPKDGIIRPPYNPDDFQVLAFELMKHPMKV